MRNYPEKYEKEFQAVFQMPLKPWGSMLLIAVGIWSFDVVRFNDYCVKRLGYKEGKISLKQFLYKKYGKKVQQLIKNIICYTEVKR